MKLEELSIDRFKNEPKKEEKIDKKTGKKIKNGKEKTFFGRLFNKQRLEKTKKVAVVYLRENGNAEMMEVETKKGFFQIGGNTYHERRDCTFTVQKDRLPLAIIPEWNLTPIGTKHWDEKTLQQKFSNLQEHAIRGIRNAELVKSGERDKVKLNAKAIVGIVIVAIIAVAIFMGYR